MIGQLQAQPNDSTANVARSVVNSIDARGDELIALLLDLIRTHPIYGSPGQKQAQRILGQALHQLGFDVEERVIDKARLRTSPLCVPVATFGGVFDNYEAVDGLNILATRKFSDTGPHLILNGHVDVEFITAPDAWRRPGLWSEGDVADGRVYGRGAADMLGAIACYVHVMRCLSPYFSQGRGSITLQLVVDEEIGGNGTLWELMNTRRGQSHHVLIGEPTNLSVCGATRGFEQLKIVSRGEPVHMAYATRASNANYALRDIIDVLEQTDTWIGEISSHPRTGRFLVYGVVQGGVDAATPAAQSEVCVTLALPPDFPQSRVEEYLAEKLSRLPSDPTIEEYGLRFPGSSLADENLSDVLQKESHHLGYDVTHSVFPSACDARLFEAFHMPTIVFGPGSLQQAHAPDEYVEIAELQQYSKVLAASILRMWQES